MRYLMSYENVKRQRSRLPMGSFYQPCIYLGDGSLYFGRNENNEYVCLTFDIDEETDEFMWVYFGIYSEQLLQYEFQNFEELIDFIIKNSQQKINSTFPLVEEMNYIDMFENILDNKDLIYKNFYNLIDEGYPLRYSNDYNYVKNSKDMLNQIDLFFKAIENSDLKEMIEIYKETKKFNF